MKRKTVGASPRRPPNSLPAQIPRVVSEAAAAQSAGGPIARGEGPLARCLADFLAYFEIRKVCKKEIDLIRPTHANGWLLPQLEAKLARLNPNCPDHKNLGRLVELSIKVLTAVDEGRFDPGPNWTEIEPRLLRALAYFISESDAIPDHLPHGFDDDMREFCELAERADDLFTIFEAYEIKKAK